MRSNVAWLAAAASGLLIWEAAAQAMGGREPWDSPAYWTLWLPLAGLACLLLGIIFPERPWRWPIAVMLAQLPVMMINSGEVGSLAPLGAILLLLISVPLMLPAVLGAAIRGRIGNGARS